LLRLDGVPVVTPAPLPTVTGRSIRAFVAPDLEIELRVRSHGVEIFKILHGPLAPTSLTWGVQVGDDSKIRFDLMHTEGRDNILRAAATRPIGLNRVRRIEMTHSRTPDDFVTVPGRNTYEVTETFTGRTRFIDPVTGARSWVSEFEYPVEIDVTITELIAAAGDDGAGTGGFWYTASSLNKSTYNAGFRFQTAWIKGMKPQLWAPTCSRITSGRHFTPPGAHNGDLNKHFGEAYQGSLLEETADHRHHPCRRFDSPRRSLYRTGT
jgi:hypothetical protein